jgi:hypothetical protein
MTEISLGRLNPILTASEYSRVGVIDKEHSSSDMSTERTLEKSSRQNELRLPRLVLASECVNFVRRRGQYVPEKQWKFRAVYSLAWGF